MVCLLSANFDRFKFRIITLSSIFLSCDIVLSTWSAFLFWLLVRFKVEKRFISFAFLTSPLFDCLHFIVSLFVPSFTNGDFFIFTYSSSVYQYVQCVYIINGGLACFVHFWSHFSPGFGAVAQQVQHLIYFLLQMAQRWWAFARVRRTAVYSWVEHMAGNVW